MRAQDQTLDGAPLVRMMLDVLVALQISQKRRCDLFIAVAAVVLKDRGECEGDFTPAPVSASPVLMRRFESCFLAEHPVLLLPVSAELPFPYGL
jgi:hypothetical protein